jgi:hypothetical protein
MNQVPMAVRIALILWVSAIFQSACVRSAFCQEGSLRAEDALSKIKQAKILDPKYSVKLAFTGEEEATLNVERNPKATDNDCKIDAVLLAKTIMSAYPSRIVRVKVVFTKRDQSSEEAIVTAGDVRSFATESWIRKRCSTL